METWAFEPLYSPQSGTGASNLQPSVTVTAGVAAAASTVFPGTTNNSQRNLQIANTTTSWAYLNLGVVGVLTAATVATGYPVAPGAVVVLTVGNDVTGASVILGTTPGTNTAVTFTRGVGI